MAVSLSHIRDHLLPGLMTMTTAGTTPPTAMLGANRTGTIRAHSATSLAIPNLGVSVTLTVPPNCMFNLGDTISVVSVADPSAWFYGIVKAYNGGGHITVFPTHTSVAGTTGTYYAAAWQIDVVSHAGGTLIAPTDEALREQAFQRQKDSSEEYEALAAIGST